MGGQLFWPRLLWGVVVFVFLKHGMTRRMGAGMLALLCCNVTPQRATCTVVRPFVLLSKCRHSQLRKLLVIRFVFGISMLRAFVVRFFFLASRGIIRYHSVDLLSLLFSPSPALRRGHSFQAPFPAPFPRSIQTSKFASKLKAKRTPPGYYTPTSILYSYSDSQACPPYYQSLCFPPRSPSSVRAIRAQ